MPWKVDDFSLFNANWRPLEDSVEFFRNQIELRNNRISKTDLRAYLISSGMDCINVDAFIAIYFHEEEERIDLLATFLEHTTSNIMF